MARRITETELAPGLIVWDEWNGNDSETIGIAVLSPLTGAWLVAATEGRTLTVFDREPAWTRYADGVAVPTFYPPSLRRRSLTGARMVLLGGNGHRYRGHTSVTEVVA